jgi:hypothetical protein
MVATSFVHPLQVSTQRRLEIIFGEEFLFGWSTQGLLHDDVLKVVNLHDEGI